MTVRAFGRDLIFNYEFIKQGGEIVSRRLDAVISVMTPPRPQI